jgi:hypothetical protein
MRWRGRILIGDNDKQLTNQDSVTSKAHTNTQAETETTTTTTTAAATVEMI